MNLNAQMQRCVDFRDVRASWNSVIADANDRDQDKIALWIENNLSGPWSFRSDVSEGSRTVVPTTMFAFENREAAKAFATLCPYISHPRLA